jgi:class 3 adenylate cyclase
MSIRTSLIISYLALILLVTFGMWYVSDTLMDKLTDNDLIAAETAVSKVATDNYQLSQEVLTKIGERIVAARAEIVAKELAVQLGSKKSYDYARLRKNKRLREIATQEIFTPHGHAGYMDLIDNTGVAVFHPNKEVEGRNFSEWQEEFPEMWRLVALSFKNPKVEGYYRFLDENNNQRDKFMALMQVPGTPFIVVAAVNIDEFFLPVQARIKQGAQETITKGKQAIKEVADSIDKKAKMVSLICGLFFSLLGGLSGVLLAASISRPLLRLRDGVGQIGEGNFSVAVPEKGAKEVVQLAHSFNHLGRQLIEYIEKRDFIRDTFGRYVTQEVVKRLLESKEALELGGEIREVSIIMSDLRGFTALTAEMDPEQVITFLNRYLGKMIEILLDFRAVIDEIVGDGILAFFGAPEPLEDHPVRAVACALKMQTAMDEINSLNEADGLPHLEMGIAVNTGSVVVGNIGSERRTKYSVVGSSVNFTSRIEAYALGGQVLLSAGTFERVRDLVKVGGTIQAQMKGVLKPATLYEVLSISGPYNIQLKERSDTLVPLPEKISIYLQRLSEKIVIGGTRNAWINQWCETAASVTVAGELAEWEDVRIHLLDENKEEMPGKIYGKVIAIQPGDQGFNEATIRFTSVSPEIYQSILKTVGNDSEVKV